MTTATLPVCVSADAAARIKQLGMEQEFEVMLEHTREHVENLRSIDVTWFEDQDELGNSWVLITAWKNGPESLDDQTREKWHRWQTQTFSPDVFRWFSFDSLSWDLHGR